MIRFYFIIFAFFHLLTRGDSSLIAYIVCFADDFDGIFEMHPTTEKHLYVVDAGLTFNSPYPVVLRPQREVDIILSFDFSARPGDSSPPFKVFCLDTTA